MFTVGDVAIVTTYLLVTTYLHSNNIVVYITKTVTQEQYSALNA